MPRSPIYRSPRLYELVMRILYRSAYASRFSAVADLIPPASSVLELCCGPGALYLRYLKDRGVSYVGLDVSREFISYLQAQGVDARLWDVRWSRSLPRADSVVMQASLFRFLPDPRPVVDRMLEAARERVIVAEPVRNLASSGGILRRISAQATNCGFGPQPHRFDEEALDRFFAGYGSRVERGLLLPGNREKAYVLHATTRSVLDDTACRRAASERTASGRID